MHRQVLRFIINYEKVIILQSTWTNRNWGSLWCAWNQKR